MTKTAVIGGGALGLTVAYRLAQHGDDVTVIEREPLPGGLAAGFQLGPSYLEKFYHHLFQSDRAATALIEEVGLGDKLVWPRPITAWLIDNEVYQFDDPISLLRYKPLPFIDRIRTGVVGLYLKLEKSHTRFEGQTADRWMRTWFGERAYRIQWEPLLKAKFHDHYATIAMSWMWSRIHLRSPRLGYIKGGFQLLYNRLAERITEMGGELRFETSVSRIVGEPDGRVTLTIDGETGTFDRVVSTLPTRLTIQLTEGLPASFTEQYNWGQALGAHCLILELDRQFFDERFNNVYWLSINDTSYPFLAVVEHTNYMPASDYDEKHLLYLGNYLPMDHPLLKAPKDEIVEEFLPHLQRINPDFRPEWVTGSHSFAAPYAQPVITPEYPAHIPPHETPIPNLYLANMFQVYPQDRGQNYSIAMAERLARQLTKEA